MPTDDERRAVARRLRRSRSEWSGTGWRLWLGPKFCAVVLSDGNRDELEDAAHRLADLIEPSCDRDALLRLARYMDKDVAETEAHFSNVISTKSVSDYARRIREACHKAIDSDGSGIVADAVADMLVNALRGDQ